ncbi:MAG: ABC transporter ATP-binding protein [Caldilineaceae bacterium]|jgi:putative ABC transport system ATP-binding protein|nr:ABC transporter ATP-binding protein [Caldilineaceae bacterium]
MSIIELRDVSKSYHIGEIETRALDGVSLAIEAGEFTALVGPSGSGKTTMLQIIGCLDKPDRGSVLINGQDVTRLNANRRADLRREVIGFIFQFFALVPVLDAYENVELPLLLNGVGAKERRTRALEMLDAVGLSDRVHHRPDQLSGGQQQRVAIARALAPRPLMVLADEPTANLDTANGEQAMEIMKRLNEQTGTAFIFATHDPRVMSFARRTVKMLDGRIVEDGIENGVKNGIKNGVKNGAGH